MRSTKWALVAASLLSASPALAGGGARGDWELGVFGGYGWLDDYRPLNPKNDLFYGARLGYFFTPSVSFEVTGQRLPTERDTVATPNLNMELDALRLNGFFNFLPGSRFRPFLTAGAGYEITDVDEVGKSSDFGWNAGGGFRVFFNPRWSLRADGRYVSINVADLDEIQNNIEAGLGLSVTFGGDTKGEMSAPAQPNRTPSVACVTDRAEVLPGESVTIRANASDPEGDPLTYQWTTTAGRMSPSGSSAMLDFTGATPPSTATVTVSVSDNHGNTATSECAVRLVEPVRPAESVSCLAGGFPRNLSRLTNVDKACLDDIATRLKADPRARVVVIGHADRRESSPERISEQRSTAVRDYLVTTGIESSRITVRSSAASKPASEGTDAMAQAGNRRVEVWFVPEGATMPE